MASFYALPRNFLRASARRFSLSSSAVAEAEQRPAKRTRVDLWECLSCDIDGTIANISARLKMAERQYPAKCFRYFNVLLDGRHYHMDKPVIAAREFLKEWVQGDQRVVVYLSGRRAGTEAQTQEWLHKHEFPDGEIIHRSKGVMSEKFKADELKKLQCRYKVAAHIGDRDDDELASKTAKVRFVRVKLDEWVTREDVREQKLENLVTIVRTDDGVDGNSGFAAFHSESSDANARRRDSHDANDNEKVTATSSKTSSSDSCTNDLRVGCDVLDPPPPPPPRARGQATDDREDVPPPPPRPASYYKTSDSGKTSRAPRKEKTHTTSLASLDVESIKGAEDRTRTRKRRRTVEKSDDPFSWQ